MGGPPAAEEAHGLPAATTPPHSTAGPLPDQPLVVIEPSRSWVAVNLRDLWRYRELLYLLAWRDIKVRYKQTALGAAWVVLQPLITTLVFTVFLGKLAQVPSDGVPYPLFAFAGLLPWTFFSGAVTNTGSSLVGNAHLITKVYFPRMIIPGATVAGRLVDFAVSFAVLGGMLLWYGFRPTWQLLLAPIPLLLLVLLAMGVGMWFSALNVKYRDVTAVLPTLIQLWMYLSPIVYPLSLVPKQWQWLYLLNPLTGIIKAFRSSVLGIEFDWTALAASAAATLALLTYAAYAFRRMEKHFADVV